MKRKPDDRTPPSAEEMLRYHSGEMTPGERHALERKLEASSFYRDAEEGLASLSEADIAKDISDMRAKFEKSQNPSKPGWHLPLQIAAGVTIIFIAGWLLLNNNEIIKSQTEPDITRETQDQDDLLTYEVPEEDIKEEELEDQAEAILKKNKEPIRENQEGALESQRKDAFSEDEIKMDDDTLLAIPDLEESIGLEMDQEEILADIELAIPEEPRITSRQENNSRKLALSPPALAQDAPSERMLEGKVAGVEIKPLVKVIRGKVMSSEDLSPLPGVNVILKGTTTGAISNIDGEFTIELQDNTSKVLVFSFIGLKSSEFEIGGQQYIEVTMSPDMTQLSEVVVTGYGTDHVSSPPVIVKARPEGGFSTFKKYLNQNMLYPDGYDLKGVVELQFTILTNGEIANIKVVDSPGEPFEKEAIRLLKEFPVWQPATVNGIPREEEIKLKIRFKPGK